MKLLYVMIALFFGAAVYNFWSNDWFNSLGCLVITILLAGVSWFFKRQDQRLEVFTEWLMDHRDDIYNERAEYDGIRVVPDTRLVQYQTCISLGFFHSSLDSSLYIKGSPAGTLTKIVCTFATLILGWWSIPWGPLLSVVTSYRNITGRVHLTVHEILHYRGIPPKLKKAPKLTKAVLNGNIEKVSNLLFKGIDPDVRDEEGRTPIMRAAELGTAEMVQLLIDGGADLNSKDSKGDNVLIRAAVNGKSEIVGLLLRHNLNPNEPNHHDDTALMKASNRGYTNVIKVLLEYGAKLDLQNQQGMTALMLSVHGNMQHAVEMLLQAGADMTLRNEWDETVINIANDLGVYPIEQALHNHEVLGRLAMFR